MTVTAATRNRVSQPGTPAPSGLSNVPQPYAQYLPQVMAASKKYSIPPEIVLGVMKRETNGQNIVGDGGHGRGLMQIDDRSFGSFLAANKGGLDRASNIDKGAEILRSNLNAFGGDYNKALAAYNAGVGGVQSALARGASPDSVTTGGDYGSAVLANARQFGNGSISSTGSSGGVSAPGAKPFSLQGKPMGGDVSTHTLLKLGSQGKEVKQLQAFLQKQGFLKQDANGTFDAATDAAVKAYQSAAGLSVDGEVGQQTWGSFMGKSYPPGVSMLRNGGVAGYSTQDSYAPGSGATSAGGVDPSTITGGSSARDRLAQAGRAAAMSLGGYNSEGLCATGVARAISSAFGISVSGNGNTIGANLPTDKFKEVNMSLEQALKTPGMVLTWQHTSTAAGSIYGHTAITVGDGHTSCSDFIENDTMAGSTGRTGLHIYMPIG